MSNTLEELARSYSELQRVRREFTPIKERWYSWNYWAQHGQKLFSFGQWMTDNELEYDIVVGSKRRYERTDVIYDREEGYRYYSAWRGASEAIAEAEDSFNAIFRWCWYAKAKDDTPIYSLEQLSAAMSKSAEELRKFAAKRSWYFPRGKKGTK